MNLIALLCRLSVITCSRNDDTVANSSWAGAVGGVAVRYREARVWMRRDWSQWIMEKSME